MALSGDGRHIVSGSGDRTVAVWDLQTGARLHELTGHHDWVRSVALSGDGRYIVSGSGDRDGGGVGPPDRCTAAPTDWAPG